VQPKPPSGFKDYLMNRCTYVLAGNSNSRVVNTQTPSPANLHEQLKKLFVEQEKERQRLRVQVCSVSLKKNNIYIITLP
jgi:hypothetical protein